MPFAFAPTMNRHLRRPIAKDFGAQAPPPPSGTAPLVRPPACSSAISALIFMRGRISGNADGSEGEPFTRGRREPENPSHPTAGGNWTFTPPRKRHSRNLNRQANGPNSQWLVICEPTDPFSTNTATDKTLSALTPLRSSDAARHSSGFGMSH